MNQAGCPSGWATDEILLPDEAPGRCDMLVSVWTALLTLACVLQIFVSVSQTWLWTRRERLRRENTNLRSTRGMFCARRLPIVPFINWTIFLLLILSLVLSCVYVVHSSNGGPQVMAALIMGSFCAAHVLLLLKFVSMGYATLRIGGKLAINRAAGSTSTSVHSLDSGGRIIIFLCILCSVACVLTLAIFGVLYPDNYLVIQIAFGFMTMNALLIGISSQRQVERVKSALSQSINVHKEILSSYAVPGSELLRVRRKLVEHQIVIGLATVVLVLFQGLIAGGVIRTRYFVMAIYLLLAQSIFVSLTVSNIMYIFRKRTVNTNKGEALVGTDSNKLALMSASNPVIN